MSDNPTSADQNQDDVEKIDDREIERQAKVFVTTKYKKEFRGPALDSYIKGYKRALKWRDKNPSPAVKGLVEALRFYADGDNFQTSGCAWEGCEASPTEIDKNIEVEVGEKAQKALAAFEKELKNE